MPIGEQYHEIGNQIRQRVDAIGNQSLGMRNYTDHHLQRRQNHVEDDTDECALTGDDLFFRRQVVV
ncbi:hypothetical protein Y049_1840 [Burkholderia pseudomallei MSHR684]|nr:hypothetical protein Y049_1840 [Burkholderia pseudomallei MSHR684]